MPEVPQPATDEAPSDRRADSTTVGRTIAGAQLVLLLLVLGVFLAALVGVLSFLTVAGVREFIG
jgi:hypothetical protein